jgi:hypothetical protein
MMGVGDLLNGHRGPFGLLGGRELVAPLRFVIGKKRETCGLPASDSAAASMPRIFAFLARFSCAKSSRNYLNLDGISNVEWASFLARTLSQS